MYRVIGIDENGQNPRTIVFGEHDDYKSMDKLYKRMYEKYPQMLVLLIDDRKNMYLKKLSAHEKISLHQS